jgi:S1-C subfamily serine protease
VEDGGPADRAGLKGGEIILSVDGRDLKNPSDLARYVRTKKPGDKVTLKVRNKDKVVQMEVTLDKIKE